MRLGLTRLNDLEARFEHPVHDVELVAVVEAERELMQIELKILGGNLVVDANQTPLEQAPYILYSVGAYSPMGIALDLVHGAMGELGAIEPQVGRELVGVKLGSALDMLTDEISNGGCTDILDSFHEDFARCPLS